MSDPRGLGRTALACFAVCMAAALGGVLAVGEASGHTPAKHRSNSGNTRKPTCGVVPKPPSRHRKTAKPTPSGTAVDPFTTRVGRAYLSARGGSVTAAVDDLVSGQMWIYHPGVRHVTASIIKVDILETLLDQAQRRHEWLDGAAAGTIEGMIEDSDNDDATSLWNHVGGPGGVGAYNAQVGLRQTSPNVAWGLTTTSAADQIRLLCQLVEPDSPLDSHSQDYALSLMQSVNPAQAWGVSGGIPGGVTVALKNGWLPLSSDNDWEINSIGRVKGDDRHYLIAVLTNSEPYGYGIATISGLSRLVWNDLKPVKPKHRKGPKHHKKAPPAHKQARPDAIKSRHPG